LNNDKEINSFLSSCDIRNISNFNKGKYYLNSLNRRLYHISRYNTHDYSIEKYNEHYYNAHHYSRESYEKENDSIQAYNAKNDSIGQYLLNALSYRHEYISNQDIYKYINNRLTHTALFTGKSIADSVYDYTANTYRIKHFIKSNDRLSGTNENRRHIYSKELITKVNMFVRGNTQAYIQIAQSIVNKQNKFKEIICPTDISIHRNTHYKLFISKYIKSNHANHYSGVSHYINDEYNSNKEDNSYQYVLNNDYVSERLGSNDNINNFIDNSFNSWILHRNIEDIKSFTNVREQAYLRLINSNIHTNINSYLNSSIYSTTDLSLDNNKYSNTDVNLNSNVYHNIAGSLSSTYHHSDDRSVINRNSNINFNLNSNAYHIVTNSLIYSIYKNIACRLNSSISRSISTSSNSSIYDNRNRSLISNTEFAEKMFKKMQQFYLQNGIYHLDQDKTDRQEAANWQEISDVEMIHSLKEKNSDKIDAANSEDVKDITTQTVKKSIAYTESETEKVVQQQVEKKLIRRGNSQAVTEMTVHQLVEKVYSEITRKLRLEQLTRGL
jgi:hypothetical protein